MLLHYAFGSIAVTPLGYGRSQLAHKSYNRRIISCLIVPKVTLSSLYWDYVWSLGRLWPNLARNLRNIPFII